MTLKTLSWLVLPFVFAIGLTSNAQQPGPYELSGFTPEEIFAIADETPLLASDLNVRRLLDRASSASNKALRRFNRMTTNPTILQLNQNPRDFRCHVIQLSGRARKVFKIQTEESNQGFFVLQMEDHAGNECLICLNQIPSNWPIEESIEQPIAVIGFYLANFDLLSDEPTLAPITLSHQLGNTPVIVAHRLQWYPSQTNTNIPVKQTQTTLAAHGVDIAQIDHVKPSGGLTAQDADLFYQILSACRQINQIESELPTRFTDCLKQPREKIGDALQFTGQLRSVTKIKIDDPEVMSSLGQDHYFQLVVFAPLERQQIVIRNPDNGREGASQSPTIVHENRYPIVVCVTSLPHKSSEMIRQKVAISGFFLKLWNYESGHSESTSTAPKQISPLVIALAPKIIPPPDNPLNFWIGVGAASALLGVALLFWFVKSDAAKSRSSGFDRGSNLPDQIEFQSID